MAKKIKMKTNFDSSSICVPSDILSQCETIYSNFKKSYDKYAPGKLAFFRFNSTIVDNLEKLQKSCPDLYKISVYGSYFRNCQGIGAIQKRIDKIYDKLDSLLDAIGKGKEASLSTLGVKGLLSKRSKDKDFNKFYDDFEKFKGQMEFTIKNNKLSNDANTPASTAIDALSKEDKFKLLTYEDSTEQHKSLSIPKKPSEGGDFKKELTKTLETVNTNFCLTKTDISKFPTSKEIPSYAEVMSSFLTNAEIEYDNLYRIQHNYKEMSDMKGKVKNNDSDDTEKIKYNYQTCAQEIKGYKLDLKSSIEYLENSSKKFEKYWSKDTKQARQDINKAKNDMKELYKQIRNSDMAFRSEFFAISGTGTTTSYSNMMIRVSKTMGITFDNISKLELWVLTNGEYSKISGKDSPLFALKETNFLTIKSNIGDYINNYEVAKATEENKLKSTHEEALSEYIKSFEEIQSKYKDIYDTICTVYKSNIKHLHDNIEDQEKHEAFNKVKNTVNMIANFTGTSVSIIGALVGLIPVK